MVFLTVFFSPRNKNPCKHDRSFQTEISILRKLNSYPSSISSLIKKTQKMKRLTTSRKQTMWKKIWKNKKGGKFRWSKWESRGEKGVFCNAKLAYIQNCCISWRTVRQRNHCGRARKLCLKVLNLHTINNAIGRWWENSPNFLD